MFDLRTDVWLQEVPAPQVRVGANLTSLSVMGAVIGRGGVVTRDPLRGQKLKAKPRHEGGRGTVFFSGRVM